VANAAPLPHQPPNRGELAAATAAFLDHADLAPTTRASTASLAALVDALHPAHARVTPSSWGPGFRARYAAAAPRPVGRTDHI
jgi:hypothetical protein